MGKISTNCPICGRNLQNSVDLLGTSAVYDHLQFHANDLMEAMSRHNTRLIVGHVEDMEKFKAEARELNGRYNDLQDALDIHYNEIFND